ncbi:MAG: TrkH family potassium uptake protein, partial [Erysipelotrichaceae bacterium]
GLFLWRNHSPAQNIVMTFAMLILGGAILLTLPICNKSGLSLNFLDALFTATSASCVTGLVTVITFEQYNVLGQIVIILLIQFGGLGVMTIMATFILMLKNRLTMNEKIAMRDMLNHDYLSDMKGFILDILKYTFIFESIGALLLMIVFIPEFGIISGIWKGIFLSISAFCNAGFDILGANSLIPYQTNPIINFTIMSLIILGGLGFAVWFDLRDKIVESIKKKVKLRKFIRTLAFHSKIVIVMTLILIFVPAIIMFLLEMNNPATFGNLSFFDKIQCALFQSVTLRTCGFASVDYAGLTLGTKFIMIICMFIGGSPGGTAGGIKTTTLAVIIIFMVSTFFGKQDGSIFKRSINKDIVLRAITIFMINIIALSIGIFILCLSEGATLVEIMFECASALATVGLTLGITTGLSTIGKITIISLMYIGRIGAITLLISVIKKGSSNRGITYPNATIIVG